MKHKSKYRPKPKGSVLAALDIGSSKIACFIARLTDDEGHFEVLGVGHQASKGIKAGTVTDLNDAENAIRKTVHAAENMAVEAMKGYPLREVIINVPTVHARSHRFTVDVDISGQEVTDNDMRRALAKAQSHAVNGDRDRDKDGDADRDVELIHTIPNTYTIDGKNGIREPRGMFGDIMEVDINLVTGDASALRNIATCIERSHLDIAALCESAYAAGLSSLVEDEMNLGCTVIDMGGGVTSMAVFYGGTLVYCDAIPVGGQHVTSDIARGLTVSLSDAERLKVLYGSAVASRTDENELIDVPQIGEAQQTHPNHAPRSLLVGIIQPRLEEILELVRAKLKDSGVGHQAGRRVILTGGASQLPGLRDLGQMVLDKQVRLGRPFLIEGVTELYSGPDFATTAGLLTYISERSNEMPAEIMAQIEPGTLFERAKFWLKENW